MKQVWVKASPYENLAVDQTVRLAKTPSVFGKIIECRPHRGEANVMIWTDDRSYEHHWFLYDQLLISKEGGEQ